MTSFTKRRKERIVRKEILITLIAVFSIGSVIISQSRHCCAFFFCLAECRNTRHHLTEYSCVSTLADIFSFIRLWIKDFIKTGNRSSSELIPEYFRLLFSALQYIQFCYLFRISMILSRSLSTPIPVRNETATITGISFLLV